MNVVVALSVVDLSVVDLSVVVHLSISFILLCEQAGGKPELTLIMELAGQSVEGESFFRP